MRVGVEQLAQLHPGVRRVVGQRKRARSTQVRRRKHGRQVFEDCVRAVQALDCARHSRLQIPIQLKYVDNLAVQVRCRQVPALGQREGDNLTSLDLPRRVVARFQVFKVVFFAANVGPQTAPRDGLAVEFFRVLLVKRIEHRHEAGTEVAERPDQHVPVLVQAVRGVHLVRHRHLVRAANGRGEGLFLGTLVGDVVRGLRGALVADGLGFVDDVLGGPVQVQLGDGAVGFFPDFPGFGVGLSDEADDAALGLRELGRLL